MCVICCKPAGVKMPPLSMIRAMYQQNHDGCGFVSSSGKTCKTLSFGKFLQELAAVPDTDACILHFRWATHGSVSTKNCHPFYDPNTDTWFAHNGVLPIESKNDMTDSEICFRETLVPALKQYGIGSKAFHNIAKRASGSSRFAFLHDNEIYIVGNFTPLNDGCYYSNTNFLWRLDRQTAYDTLWGA